MRERRGCEGPTPDPLFEFEGTPIHECPAKLISPETRDFLTVYGLCLKLKKFPLAGGLYDQTDIYIQATTLVMQLSQDIEKDNMKQKTIQSRQGVGKK